MTAVGHQAIGTYRQNCPVLGESSLAGAGVRAIGFGQGCWSGLVWVYRVATVYLGLWLGGDHGRARPEVCSLVRGLWEGQLRLQRPPVLGKGRWVLPMGSNLPLHLWPQNGNQVLSVSLSSVCPCTGPGSRARVSLDLGGQSVQLWGSNAAAWPHPGHLASCRQGGLGPHCTGTAWTPVPGENRSLMLTALLRQRGWVPLGLGTPSSCSRSHYGPFVWLALRPR